jgi:hypothetical protein
MLDRIESDAECLHLFGMTSLVQSVKIWTEKKGHSPISITTPPTLPLLIPWPVTTLVLSAKLHSLVRNTSQDIYEVTPAKNHIIVNSAATSLREGETSYILFGEGATTAPTPKKTKF